MKNFGDAKSHHGGDPDTTLDIGDEGCVATNRGAELGLCNVPPESFLADALVDDIDVWFRFHSPQLRTR
jgi:hypothetical protein